MGGAERYEMIDRRGDEPASHGHAVGREVLDEVESVVEHAAHGAVEPGHGSGVRVMQHDDRPGLAGHAPPAGGLPAVGIGPVPRDVVPEHERVLAVLEIADG